MKFRKIIPRKDLWAYFSNIEDTSYVYKLNNKNKKVYIYCYSCRKWEEEKQNLKNSFVYEKISSTEAKNLIKKYS